MSLDYKWQSWIYPKHIYVTAQLFVTYEHEREHLSYSLSLQPGLVLGPCGLGNNPLIAVISEIQLLAFYSMEYHIHNNPQSIWPR